MTSSKNSIPSANLPSETYAFLSGGVPTTSTTFTSNTVYFTTTSTTSSQSSFVPLITAISTPTPVTTPTWTSSVPIASVTPPITSLSNVITLITSYSTITPTSSSQTFQNIPTNSGAGQQENIIIGASLGAGVVVFIAMALLARYLLVSRRRQTFMDPWENEIDAAPVGGAGAYNHYGFPRERELYETPQMRQTAPWGYSNNPFRNTLDQYHRN